MLDRKPLAIAFDLDGTLIDSKGDICAACNHALQSVGRAPLADDVIAGFVGDGARILMARALGHDPSDPLVGRALSAFHPFYEAHPADHTVLFPGAREVLDACGDRPIALVTNKPRGATLALLDVLGMRARFAVIRAGSDGPLKPDPRAVLDALEPLGVAAADAWLVGDADQDARAGRAAGCTTILVRGGFQSEERRKASAPDAIVDTLFDVVTLLARATR